MTNLAVATCLFRGCEFPSENPRSEPALCPSHLAEAGRGNISQCPKCDSYKSSATRLCSACGGEWRRRGPSPWSQDSIALNRSVVAGIRRVKRNLSRRSPSAFESAEGTGRYCVLPIAQGLGWNARGASDLNSETTIPGAVKGASAQIAYTLSVSGSPVVRICVSRGEDDPNSMRPVFSPLKNGYGVLTNGKTWDIYRVNDGEARIAAQAAIAAGDEKQAAGALRLYLSKTNRTNTWPMKRVESRRAATHYAADSRMFNRLKRYFDAVESRNPSRRGSIPSEDAIRKIVDRKPTTVPELERSGIFASKDIPVFGRTVARIVKEESARG